MIILQFRLAQKSTLISQNTYINSLRPFLGTGEQIFKWLEDKGKFYLISIKNYGNTPAIIETAYLIWSRDKIKKEILFSNDPPPSGYHRTYLKHSETGAVYPNASKWLNFERDQKKEGYFGVFISYNYFTNQIGRYGITYAYDKEKGDHILQNEWID